MYSEFQANILYSPGVIDPEDRLTFVLFGENVFTVDSVLAKVDSFEGVKSADVYILTKWQYYDDWIMKELTKDYYHDHFCINRQSWLQACTRMTLWIGLSKTNDCNYVACLFFYTLWTNRKFLMQPAVLQ